MDVGGQYTTIKRMVAPRCSIRQPMYSKCDVSVSVLYDDNSAIDSPVLNIIPTPPPV